MIGHYLLALFAAMRRAPFTTAANVLTLALGLVCFLTAVGVASYWRASDTHHAGAERTYFLAQGFLPRMGDPIPMQTYGTAAAARYLTSEFPEVEIAARAHAVGKTAIAAGEKSLLLQTAYAEPGFLSIFDFDFIAGDPRHALSQPGSVILTRDAARQLFGDVPALGQRIVLGANRDAVVTGVIASPRRPSFMGEDQEANLHFELLGRWDLSPRLNDVDAEEEWYSAQTLTVFRLKPGASIEAVKAQLPGLIDRRMPAQQRQLIDIELGAFPIHDLIVHDLDVRLFAANGLKFTTAGALLTLGSLILLAAGVNYANLATAQATLAAKQMGLRKVLGAGRLQIMIQSWLGSLIQTLAALVLCLGLLAATAPAIEASTGVEVLYFLSADPSAFFLIAGLVVIVSLAAGAYPALVLSGVQPIQALQSGRSRSGPKFVARILVGVQFATAAFLVILLTVSYMQRGHLERLAFGARQDPIVILNELQSIGVDGQALIAALRQLPGVKSATLSERAPWTDSGSFLPLTRTPEAGAQEYTTLARHVAHDYFSTLGMKVLAGRVFDPAHETVTRTFVGASPSQPVPIVIDERLAQSMGFASPQAAAGQTIYASASLMKMAGGAVAQPLEIIGVIEADPTWLGNTPSRGNHYFFGPDSPLRNGQFPILRLEPDGMPRTLAAVTRTWSQFAPTTPADIKFFDQMFEYSYRQYARIGRLFTLLANIALVIAALGLLGIAVHVTARRHHEIAVRKTLGSTTLEAAGLLLADFSKPVIAANLVAWPLGYFAAKAYLSAFAYRIEPGPWPFLASLVLTLGIAWLVVAGNVVRTSRVSPAQALRDQ